MTWVRIDDSFPNHPKIIGLSDGAFRLYITALCYSNAYLTDGIVPQKTIKKLSNSRHISALIDANLWEKCGDDIIILGYEEYQFTKEKVETERKKAAERMNRSRVLRRTEGATSPEVHPPHTHPIPIPIPNIDLHTFPSEMTSFEEFWKLYPRKQAKGSARAAYLKALKKVDHETIMAGVRLFANDPNRQDEFTAHASTWLNQERWSDEAQPAKAMTRTESSVMRALEISRQLDGIDF